MTRKPPFAIARALRVSTAVFLGLAAFPGGVGEIGASADGTSLPPGSAGTTGTTETAGTARNDGSDGHTQTGANSAPGRIMLP